MDTPLREEILRRCGELDIPLVGFASADAWDDPPFEPHRRLFRALCR